MDLPKVNMATVVPPSKAATTHPLHSSRTSSQAVSPVMTLISAVGTDDESWQSTTPSRRHNRCTSSNNRKRTVGAVVPVV